MATIVSTRTSASKKILAKPESNRSTTKAVAKELDTTGELLRELHLTRPDGSGCFADQDDAAAKQLRWERLRSAVRTNGSAELAAVARRVERRDGLPATSGARKKTPATSFHSEELWTSVLRTDWSPSAAQLAVDWSTADLRCDFTVGGDRVMSGALPPQAWLDGKRLNTAGTWEEVCWNSDADADYLELEIKLDRGLRLQRQFLLTRTDGLLLVADALLGSAPADLALETTLPLTAMTKFAAADETREGRITTARRKRLVVPLGLPEWSGERCRGQLLPADDCVTLRQTANGATALYAPLCIVFDPRRAVRPATWRQLTIGENLKIQSADRAVGYRLQLGREQWLIYRSLTARANRTVLGVNLQTNFLAARFLRSGEIERLMEIED